MSDVPTMSVRRRWGGAWRGMRTRAFAAAFTALAPATLAAQHDYYNTDAGRPLRVEDALVIERGTLELQAAPLRVERSHGRYQWGVEPQLAWGALPRTQVEVGLPLSVLDAAGSHVTSAGAAGLHASLLHQLNVESLTLPAFAVGVGTLLPVGALAPDNAYLSVKGIATRSFSWGRVHLNAEGTVGPSASDVASGPAGPVAAERSRWTAGVAVDRALPLRSTLVGAEVHAAQPLASSADVHWAVGVGVRHQLDPRWAMDAGVARRLTGEDRAWSFTLGAAYAFGIPRFRY